MYSSSKIKCSLAAACVAVTMLVSEHGKDGRHSRNPVQNRFSSRICAWNDVQENPLYHEGWFKENLRCHKQSFDLLVELVEQFWCRHNEPLHWNAFFRIKDRVAVTLHYAAHGGTLYSSGHVICALSKQIDLWNEQGIGISIHFSSTSCDCGIHWTISSQNAVIT